MIYSTDILHIIIRSILTFAIDEHYVYKMYLTFFPNDKLIMKIMPWKTPWVAQSAQNYLSFAEGVTLKSLAYSIIHLVKRLNWCTLSNSIYIYIAWLQTNFYWLIYYVSSIGDLFLNTTIKTWKQEYCILQNLLTDKNWQTKENKRRLSIHVWKQNPIAPT